MTVKKKGRRFSWVHVRVGANSGREFLGKCSGRAPCGIRLIGEKKMEIRAKFAWIFVTACILVLSLPAFARPANPPQDQGTAQTQSVRKDKKQKVKRSSGKEIGKGGEDIGKGAGKGAESLGKGAGGAAGNLVTLHPGN